MRQIFKYPLEFKPQAGEHGCVVDMPEGAQVVRFGMRGPAHGRAHLTPTLWALVDNDNPTEQRRFTMRGTGHPLPRNAHYVGSWDDAPFVGHVFELVGEPLPDDLNLPADAEAAYRTLTGAGFENIEIAATGALIARGRAWRAPNDEPLTTELIMAVATLQEHGFGPVVDA